MKKIIVQEFITLDGFIEDPADKQMRWVTNSFNDELALELIKQTKNIDTLMLGRTTYEILSSYWTTDAAKARDPLMFEHLNNSSKIVFSTGLKNPQWKNSRVVRSIDKETIESIKQGGGKNISVGGSASVVHALLNLGLIDEFQFMVFPVAIGNGKRLFDNFNTRQHFKLVSNRAFKNGVLALDYASNQNAKDYN